MDEKKLGKIEFFYQSEDDREIRLTLSSQATLTEALENFETFLRAVGYDFDGYIAISREE